MIRKGSAYAPFEVLQKVVFAHKARGRRALERGQKVDFDGDLINMASGRLQTFARTGLHCVWCGLEGRRFYKEKYSGDKAFHFNLYGSDLQNAEVLMTRTRVAPKPEEGPDDPLNWQTTCHPCSQCRGMSEDPVGGADLERDLLPYVLLTDEGRALWAGFVEHMVLALPEEEREQPLHLNEQADLLDDGDLLIQAMLRETVLQFRLSPDLWRWASAMPEGASKAPS
jgi:hypothetical protein